MRQYTLIFPNKDCQTNSKSENVKMIATEQLSIYMIGWFCIPNRYLSIPEPHCTAFDFLQELYDNFQQHLLTLSALALQNIRTNISTEYQSSKPVRKNIYLKICTISFFFDWGKKSVNAYPC